MIGSNERFPIEQPRQDDVPALVELFLARPPAYWMGRVSQPALRAFLAHAIQNPRSLLLVARSAQPDAPLAGYVLAISDAVRFWLDFSLRNPFVAQNAFMHHSLRALERRKNVEAQPSGGEDLPLFDWSPSGASSARIIGLYIRPEHERKGISMDLYFGLVERLRERGIEKVEEYMNPEFSETAKKFFEMCGWKIQPCRCRGYKLTKRLQEGLDPRQKS